MKPLRALLFVCLLATTACEDEPRPAAPNPACATGLVGIKEGWAGLDTRIRESLESTSWCFADPAPLRAVVGRAITELERLKREQPTKPLRELTDPAWTSALAAVRARQDIELATARELECPDTAMVLTFRTAQQLLDATKPDAEPALTLLDEQRNPVEMPWTPTVLLLAVTDAPARIDAMVRSSTVQRDRSARLRSQVAALVAALGRDPRTARPALDAIDDSLVPILHTQLGQAKTATLAWLTQCGGT